MLCIVILSDIHCYNVVFKLCLLILRCLTICFCTKTSTIVSPISEAGIHSDFEAERSLGCDRRRPAGRGGPLLLFLFLLLAHPRGDLRATPLNALRGQEQATQDAQRGYLQLDRCKSKSTNSLYELNQLQKKMYRVTYQVVFQGFVDIRTKVVFHSFS